MNAAALLEAPYAVEARDLTRPADADHLGWLESEAIHILREVAGQCRNPALLFSGGKDSLVLLRLAEKAFHPASFPFPLLHIDTGHNFPEVIAFRDHRAAELGERLIVRSVEDSMASGRVVLRDPEESRNRHQSVTLLDAIAEFGFDACIGGARRDEEKARAKERIFSFRDAFGQWDPKNQRPELWNLYNARVARAPRPPDRGRYCPGRSARRVAPRARLPAGPGTRAPRGSCGRCRRASPRTGTSPGGTPSRRAAATRSSPCRRRTAARRARPRPRPHA